MISLQELLENSSHRHLELMARAHKIDFTRRIPKAVGLEALSDALQGGIYEKTFATLESEHIEALQALVIGGGWLPLPLFEAHFGEIRPYRPWRKNFTPRHPWRYPASVAERLFQYGFVHIRDKEMVGIVCEVIDMLPPLQQAEAVSARPAYAGHQRSDVLRDISAMLGVLMQSQAKPVHGRWFSLSLMRQINQSLVVGEDLTAIRSELQTGRLRWLHYLAQVAGLISIQNGVFTPTMSAWRWLSSPSSYQWDSLMQAVERDLESKHPLWHQFRFPDIQMNTFQVVRHILDDLAPENHYRVKDILQMLKPYLLDDSVYEIACLLRGIFVWSGILVFKRGTIFVHRQTPPSGSEGILPVHSNRDSDSDILALRDTSGEIQSLSLHVPDTPSIALTTLLSFAKSEGKGAILNQETMREAYRQGLDTATIIDTLQTITGEAIPLGIQQRIADWLQNARCLRFKAVMILESDDPAIIDRIRGDWRLAQYIDRRISATQITIYSDKRDQFLQALERRHMPVTSFVRPQETKRITDKMTSDMAEYLLLALRTYQKLQGRLDGGTPIPKALAHWLSAQIEDTDFIEAQADDLVHAVQKRIPQVHPIADETRQDEASIRRMMYLAHQRNIPITIDYYSPYLDETTTRTITIHIISDSNELTYIEAYCHLVKDKRTFRMDRILRVHEPVRQTRAV